MNLQTRKINFFFFSNLKVSQQALTSTIMKVSIAELSSFCDNRIETGQRDPHAPAHETDTGWKESAFLSLVTYETV